MAKPRSPTTSYQLQASAPYPSLANRALLFASRRNVSIPIANGHDSLYLTHLTGAYRLTLPSANAAWRGTSGNPGTPNIKPPTNI